LAAASRDECGAECAAADFFRWAAGDGEGEGKRRTGEDARGNREGVRMKFWTATFTSKLARRPSGYKPNDPLQ